MKQHIYKYNVYNNDDNTCDKNYVYINNTTQIKHTRTLNVNNRHANKTNSKHNH